MAGKLSGPKALEDLRFLVAALSSEIEKGEVSIGRVSDTGTLGRVQLSGTLALLPRRLSFWQNHLLFSPMILSSCLKDLLLFSRQGDVVCLCVLLIAF